MLKKHLLITTTVCAISFMLFPMNISAIEEKSKTAPIVNTEDFQTNDDFKKYDPAYPKKEQFGDYVLHVPNLKERLTFTVNDKNEMIGTLYAPGVSKQGGWKDATKKWGPYDSALCFAASSSNLISWYLNRYTQLHPEDTNTYVVQEENIFDRFRKGWDPNNGGSQTEALSWYFTGGFPSGSPQAQDNQLTGKEPGGYLRNKIYHNTSNRWADVSLSWQPQEKFSVYGGYDDNKFPYIEGVGGMSGEGAFSNLRGFSDQILRQLHYGPTTITILTDRGNGGSGHAITLWGADYDVKSGLVTAIHVTDSDDRSGKLTVPLEKGTDNSQVRMINYPYHPPIGNAERFTKIRESILLYAPEVVKPIKKPTISAQILGEKRINLDQKNEQVFSLKTTGHEQSYTPDYQVEFQDEKGNKIPSHMITTKYDIFHQKLIVTIKNETLTPGKYKAVITETYTKQEFMESFEFYKEKQPYTITFHANQGTGSMDVQQFEMDVKQALLRNQFIRTGYTFKGWSTQPNQTVEFKDQEAVLNLSNQTGGNVDLYAVWEANTYTITFDSSGGEGMMPSQNMIYDQAATLSKNTMMKEGFIFKGWSNTKDGSVLYSDEAEIINLTDKPNATIMLYAIWEKEVSHEFGYTVQVSDQVITVGNDFDPLAIINVFDENHIKISLDQSNIIENTVNEKVAGHYHIIYQITDQKGNTITKTVQVIVQEEKPSAPNISIEPEQPSNPNNPKESWKPNHENKMPITGDDSHFNLFVMMLVGSIGFMTVLLYKKYEY